LKNLFIGVRGFLSVTAEDLTPSQYKVYEQKEEGGEKKKMTLDLQGFNVTAER